MPRRPLTTEPLSKEDRLRLRLTLEAFYREVRNVAYDGDGSQLGQMIIDLDRVLIRLNAQDIIYTTVKGGA